MEKITPNGWAWIAVITCVLLSTTADALSTQCWKRQSWLFGIATIVISPFVFIAFGYVGHRYGLSIASSLTNSFIVIGPILVGLILFSEWKRMNVPLYIGMALIVAGITIIVLYRKETG